MKGEVPLREAGIIVVDTTFLRKLARPELAEAIQTVARTTNLRVWPSSANLVEAFAIPEPSRRRKYINAIIHWLDGRPILPFPTDLLRQAGDGLKAGRAIISLEPGNHELLTPEALLDEAIHQRSKRMGAALASVFDSVVADRKLYQAILKRDGRRSEWTTVPEFLASEWANSENMTHLVGQLWQAVDCVGEPVPLDLALACEPWQIAIEVFGATIYERAIRFQQRPKLPGIVDILQLVYLSLNRDARIFITDDGALNDLASAVLVGRYPNVRVLTSTEFFARAA